LTVAFILPIGYGVLYFMYHPVWSIAQILVLLVAYGLLLVLAAVALNGWRRYRQRQAFIRRVLALLAGEGKPRHG
jgi:membrane protein YdbS with pleckstrin-like domain